MDAQKLCQNCQAPLAADAPRGLCPACLMKVAMATGTVAGPGETGFHAAEHSRNWRGSFPNSKSSN